MIEDKPWSHGKLQLSSNRRFIEHSDGTPFFWLGDTGWLLFSRLDRREAETYLDDRKAKGYNVIQVMMVHSLPMKNIYGDEIASFNKIDWKKGPQVSNKNNYWALLDEMVKMAEDRGLYIALVPVWGTVVKDGHLDPFTAQSYGTWLGKHFKDRPNVIWLNGGDIRGDTKQEVWEVLGSAIKAQDQNHLMTFHPFGRTRSAEWFHKASWLDFNMYQSGHRRYDQEQVTPTGGQLDDNLKASEIFRGEDNWRYVLEDLAMNPVKPTIDGEPSYEGVPHGLHDPTQPRWKAADVRRYAYWSVLAGAFGHTYGNNSVMQMHKPRFEPGAFSVSKTWDEAIHDPGAGQMLYLRQLMERFDFQKGVYCPELIACEQGEKYNRLIANSGPGYAMVYAYTARTIVVDLKKALPGAPVFFAYWFDPATGKTKDIGRFNSDSNISFDPGIPQTAGNDRVLLLTAEKVES